MNKYTKEEQEFLDKAAIAYIQGFKSNGELVTDSTLKVAYMVAVALLTERKKVFGDEN